MTRKLITYIIITSTIIMISSCHTYTSFYGKTHSSIPKNDVSEVYRLDLSSQNLNVIPESISKLKDLRMLNLSNNPDLNLDKTFQKLENIKNLEILTLDSLNIKALPKSILQFKGLKQLSLAYNPNLDLNQVFKLINKLPIEFLSLKGNKIEILPENISTLASLKDLNLSYNNLKAQKNYQYLGKLPNLYSLWLDHNDLKALPNTIGELDQIRFLYIDHNQLSEIPVEMSGMKKVWVIHAGYNKFKELPFAFTKMRSLFMVHINNCDIERIPKVYETEKYPLAGLILDNNPMSNKEKEKAKKTFKGYFLLSFEQK